MDTPKIVVKQTTEGRYIAVCAEHGVLIPSSAYQAGPILTAGLHRQEHRNGPAQSITAQDA